MGEEKEFSINENTKKKRTGRRTYSDLGIEKVKTYAVGLKPSEHDWIVAKYGTITRAVKMTLMKEMEREMIENGLIQPPTVVIFGNHNHTQYNPFIAPEENPFKE